MAGSVGQVNKRYISPINFLDKRDILKQVLDIQRDDDLLDILELTGRSVPALMAEYINFTADPMFVQGDSTGATVTGSGTATVTTTLTVATSNFGRVNDLVRFPSGSVGRVTAITTAGGADTLTIKTDVGTITHVAGDKLVFFSNAQGEGSLSPTPRRWGQTSYSNLIQIFKDKAQITDIQMASQVETSWNGQNYYTNKAIADSLMSFRAQISLAMIMGKKSATKFSDASPVAAGIDSEGNPIQRTGGLDEAVATYGIVDSLTTTGTVVFDDLSDLQSQIIAARGANRYFLLGSSMVGIAYDKWLKNLGSSNTQFSLRYNMNGKEADFTVDRFTIGGLTIDKKTLGVFDHPAVQATDIAKNAYFVPQDKVKTKDGALADRIRVRTMKPGTNSGANAHGNDVYREDWLDKYADNPTSERSVLSVHFESHQGAEFLGVNAFIKQRVLV